MEGDHWRVLKSPSVSGPMMSDPSNSMISRWICISICVLLLFPCCESFHNVDEYESLYMHQITCAPNENRISGAIPSILSDLDCIANINTTHSSTANALFPKMDYIFNSTSVVEPFEREFNGTTGDERVDHALYTIHDVLSWQRPFTTPRSTYNSFFDLYAMWIFAMIGVYISIHF